MNKENKLSKVLLIIAGVWFVIGHFVFRHTIFILGVPILLSGISGVYWLVNKLYNSIQSNVDKIDTDTNNTAKCLLITAGVWFLIGSILMRTVGSAFAPSGGLDSLADALVYAFIWEIVVLGVPIILLIIGVVIWLINRHSRH
ncbi:MAG: hypothetical protein IJD02_04995 [Lachnospiraceae bacterium]|nr:hypothetical protein [Lachnospiraceae bacterium]